MCSLLIPVLPTEQLAVGMEGSGFSERDAATLFHCFPFNSPEIRILPAYIGLCRTYLHWTAKGGGTLLSHGTSVMLQVIRVHSAKRPGFSDVRSRGRAGLPPVNGWWISRSAWSQAACRQRFHSLPITKVSQDSQSLIPTNCISYSSREKKWKTVNSGLSGILLPQVPESSSMLVWKKMFSFASFNFIQFLIPLNALLVPVLTACGWVSPAAVAWHGI